MDAQTIAETLGGKPSGKGWIACCPAHDDRNPSLSITDGDDGKVLLHCHAGCSVDQIVSAAGLDLKDLFPRSNLSTQQKLEYHRQQSHVEIEAALSHELNVLIQFVSKRVADRVAAKDRGFRALRPEWMPMPNEHWEREVLAAQRIKNAMGVLYG